MAFHNRRPGPPTVHIARAPVGARCEPARTAHQVGRLRSRSLPAPRRHGGSCVDAQLDEHPLPLMAISVAEAVRPPDRTSGAAKGAAYGARWRGRPGASPLGSRCASAPWRGSMAVYAVGVGRAPVCLRQRRGWARSAHSRCARDARVLPRSAMGVECNGPSWIRTRDRRIMSPLL